MNGQPHLPPRENYFPCMEPGKPRLDVCIPQLIREGPHAGRWRYDCEFALCPQYAPVFAGGYWISTRRGRLFAMDLRHIVRPGVRFRFEAPQLTIGPFSDDLDQVNYAVTNLTRGLRRDDVFVGLTFIHEHGPA